MPDEFLLIQAGRYLGCKPWELMGKASISEAEGTWWVQAALAYRDAEEQGRADRERTQNR